MQVRIGNGVLKIVHGDITEQNTEVPLCGINAANIHLWMGAGVAGAIKRKGGEAIEREAVAQGPIDVGQAVVTSEGKLNVPPCGIIHAAAMGQDLRTDADKIKAATHNSLLLANEKQISSISLPALGTGVGGFSPQHCAKIMLAEARDLLQQAKHLRAICFVLFDKPTYEAFEQELNLQFAAKRH